MVITIEELENARRMFFLVCDLSKQLSCAYENYKAQARLTDNLYKIEEMRNHRDGLMHQLYDYQFYVMGKIQDPCIRKMVISYYFFGKDWEACSGSGPQPKQTIMEYLKHDGISSR